MKAVDKGHPVIVWRYFSRGRDAIHSAFSRAYVKDPSVVLPKTTRTERKAWPNSKFGGHASLITGYNKKRDEFLFTESWGENNRHRRMLIDEMEYTAYYVFFFTL